MTVSQTATAILAPSANGTASATPAQGSSSTSTGGLIGFVSSFQELLDLIGTLQIPPQPAIMQHVKLAWEAHSSNFSFMDLVRLLEECKSIHVRWVHKIRGKVLDDDLLEAFVAVGGGEDCGGAVNIPKMKSVVSDFQLKVDLDSFIREMDTDGNANIDFNEFAVLLRDTAGKARNSNDPLRRESLVSAQRPTQSQLALKNQQVVLSSAEYFPEDTDVAVEPREKGFGWAPGVSIAFPEVGSGALSAFSRSFRMRRGANSLRARESTPTGPDASDTHREPESHKIDRSRLSTPAPLPNHYREGSKPKQPGAQGKPMATAFYKGSGGLRALTPSVRSNQTDIAALLRRRNRVRN
jgi:hypothetical protein